MEINLWSAFMERKDCYLPFYCPFVLIIIVICMDFCKWANLLPVFLLLQRGSWGENRIEWNGAKNRWFSGWDGSWSWHRGMFSSGCLCFAPFKAEEMHKNYLNGLDQYLGSLVGIWVVKKNAKTQLKITRAVIFYILWFSRQVQPSI